MQLQGEVQILPLDKVACRCPGESSGRGVSADTFFFFFFSCGTG